MTTYVTDKYCLNCNGKGVDFIEVGSDGLYSKVQCPHCLKSELKKVWFDCSSIKQAWVKEKYSFNSFTIFLNHSPIEELDRLHYYIVGQRSYTDAYYNAKRAKILLNKQVDLFEEQLKMNLPNGFNLSYMLHSLDEIRTIAISFGRLNQKFADE